MDGFSKKTTERGIFGEWKLKKPGKKIVFFDGQLKTNRLVYVKTCKSNKYLLVIFMGKWV